MTTKVFVGNLAFQTTDQALADAFSDCGKVKSGVIITRGRRSLGYGFVEFENTEEATYAVTNKNNTLLRERQIKVELVRDPSERPPRLPYNQPGGPLMAPEHSQPQQNNPGSDYNEDPDGAAPRRRRPFPNPNRRRNRRQPLSGNNALPPGNNALPAATPSSPISNNVDGGAPTADSTPGNPRRRFRKNRNRRPPPADQPQKEKILSKTAIFVANLPFAVKDEELKDLFKDHKPKSAHVVSTRTGRSRGYGFVDFETEQDQKNAIEKMNNFKVKDRKEDRLIAVSASHSAPKEDPAPINS
jgi:RNA recognition motif-containing protein